VTESAPAADPSREAPPWTGVAIVLVLMVAGLAATQQVFLGYANLTNIARGLAIPLLLAVGATLLLTTGMIDLSIGSMLALGTMVVAGGFAIGLPAWLVVVATVLAGGVLGGVNGLLVAKARLSFFVVTLGTLAIAVFAVNGLLVGVAAVLFTGRIQSGSPLIGAGIELEVVAAVLLGGTSFLGGQSSLLGTTIGVLFIAVLQNGLNLVGVQALWSGVITGVVLILAVWVDRLRRGGAG
jgi:ribose/xylose/arabinose/galactoside ABC-type transport system permease subunit